MEVRAVSAMEEWVGAVEEGLGLPAQVATRGATDSVLDLVLDLTRDVAHGVSRPAAPVTAFLVGLAAGQAGGGTDAVQAAAAKVSALARDWPAPASE